MQFTEEHVNKRFQAHRFLYCERAVMQTLIQSEYTTIFMSQIKLLFYIISPLIYKQAEMLQWFHTIL
jgi:hypothetical protein